MKKRVKKVKLGEDVDDEVVSTQEFKEYIDDNFEANKLSPTKLNEAQKVLFLFSVNDEVIDKNPSLVEDVLKSVQNFESEL